MTEESIFRKEEETVRKAMKLLASGEPELQRWPAHYEDLLKEYSKLLRQSERLVRIGDMMQNQLSTVNAQLDHHRRVAEQANEAKSQFLAMISHDIRAPMSAVVNVIDLLLDTNLSQEQIEYLVDMKSTANAMLTLLNDVLDLSKIEAGRLDLACTTFDLWDCVGDILRTAAVTANAKKLRVASFIDRNVPFHVVGDSVRLAQVLMNLLSNAVKFTDRGEIVTRVELVSIDNREVTVRFSVSDTGIGIPEDRLSSVFREFEQADDAIVGKYGGAGLGLAICSRLVARMGGLIWVESEIGRGSTFHFSARFGVPVQPAEINTKDDLSALRGARVIVVDENLVIRRLMEDFLRQWEMEAMSAPNGAVALDLMKGAYERGTPFGIIIIDGSLNDMSCYELARWVRQDPRICDSHVILLATLDLQTDSAECSLRATTLRLPRPPRPRDLLKTMVQMVRGPERPGHLQSQQTFGPPEDGVRALRILVAEDNPINRLLAVHMLEKMGQTVSAVGDGDAVLKSVADGEFDLILMDVEMPQKTGVEAMKALREREAITGKHIPIIAVTGHDRPGDREELLVAGMDGYVSKPIDWKQLMKTIRSVTPTERH